MLGFIETYGLVLFLIGIFSWVAGIMFDSECFFDSGAIMMCLGAIIFIVGTFISIHNKIEQLNWSQVANCTNKAYHLNLNATLAKYAWFNSSSFSSISSELQSCGA